MAMSRSARPIDHAGHVGLRLFVGAVFSFLVLPIFIVVPVGFTASDFMVFPPSGWSMRWASDFISSDRWISSIGNSFIVGALSTSVAVLLGVPAALGLSKTTFRGKGFLVAILALPMVVPTIIIALALFQSFSTIGLTSSLAGIVLGHVLLGFPFVVITVTASLSSFDWRLASAAATLGAGPWTAFRKVTLPLIAPGVASGAVFAFAISFDELVVALFLAGLDQFTLPRQMFSGLRDHVTPTICVAASFMIIVSSLLLLCVELLRRRGDRFATGAQTAE